MPKTLLVIDDSATIREATRLALTGEDWMVVEATTGPQALELVERRAPDAVLCDVTVGDDDGYELCRRIRAAAAELPVVLMGAKVSHAASMASGASAVLAKPFGADELLETLESASSAGADFTSDVRDAPLTLFDLGGGLTVASQEETATQDDELEIIDLSGDEEYDDLELLDDLEPLSPHPAPAARQADADLDGLWIDFGEPEAPADRSAPSDGVFDLELDDLLGPLAPSAEEPEPPVGHDSPLAPDQPLDDLLIPLLGEQPDESDGTCAAFDSLELDLEAELAAAPLNATTPEPELEAEAGVEGPPEPQPEPPAGPEPDLGPDSAFELALGPDPEVAATAAFAFALEPEPELTPDLEPELEPGPAPDPDDLAPGVAPAAALPPELTASLAEAATRAVRDSLAESLSPERLLPALQAVVERVVWEVVPPLAERLIAEAIEKLKTEPQAEG